MTKHKPKKISIKHKLFATNLVKTKGHQTKAYKLTYPNASDVTASKNSSKVLSEHPEIKDFVVEVMRRKGMDIDNLVGKLKRLTNAKREVLLPSGEVMKLVDNSTRLSATTTALKLHGHLTTNVHVGDDNRQVNISVGDKTSGEVNTLTNKLNDLHSALALDKGQQDGEIVDADFSASDDTSEVD